MPHLRLLCYLCLLCLGCLTGASCAARASLEPLVTRAGVQFSLDQPAAHTVAVAGTFNGWSATSHPMTPDVARRRWTATVTLPPGEHLFMYVVDGVWTTPPQAADFVDDGFGARNGVVVVP